ncbi:MAG: FHA domain-containing protein [Lentisphaerae bacterium]|nr:FHA domain-containing protein [Lentisphaerota bacterium]MBQ4329500.1 FHA domain-containing protein [Lentisphaeria bacterium]
MVKIMEKNPKFTVLYEKLRGKSFEIDQEVMSIGRKDSADITIPDGSVSSHHADIIRSVQDGKVCFILRDNDSTNGTKVNNEPITERVLKNSDLITFGHVEVLFDGVSGDAEDQHITHTIDLGNTVTNTATTQTLSNFSARMMQEKKKNEQTNMLMKIIIAACGIMVLAFVFMTIIKMFK